MPTSSATLERKRNKHFVKAPPMAYKVLSLLLAYPEPDWLAALPEMRTRLGQTPELLRLTTPLFEFFAQADLIDLQENFVATFDRSRAHSLYLFEHLHGESRDRGQALVDLLHEYQAAGYEPNVDELPDHVPLFLEFLSTLPPNPAREFLEEASAILQALGQRLEKIKSPYACVFSALCALCSAIPVIEEWAPPREMDETLETFGPSSEGIEPLVKPSLSKTLQTLQTLQTLHYHPKQTSAAAPLPR